MTYPQPGPGPLPRTADAPQIRAIAAGLLALVTGLLLVVLPDSTVALIGGVLILLVGLVYAALVWRGMPLLADGPTMKEYLVVLLGATAHRDAAQYGAAQYGTAQYGAGPVGRAMAPTGPPVGAPGAPTARPVSPVESAPTTMIPTRAVFTEAMAADPSTPAATLNAIAAADPTLHPALARNPSTYPDLVDWLAALGDPAVDAELGKRADRR